MLFDGKMNTREPRQENGIEITPGTERRMNHNGHGGKYCAPLYHDQKVWQQKSGAGAGRIGFRGLGARTRVL